MALTSVSIMSPPTGAAWPTLLLSGEVYFAGGTGPFDVLHEWDTVNTFDSVNLITDSNTGVTSSKNVGTPPSNMGPIGTTWYYRVTVTDTDDSASLSSSIHTIDFMDPDLEYRWLYVEHNIGIVQGTDPDQPRFLYVNNNITSDVPVPWIRSIAPSLGSHGDTVVIYGQGFDNAARDWDCEARLYDSLELDGSYTVMAEVDFTAGAEEDVLTVTIPGGSSSGWLVVVNDDGA